jgi:hypothetical protein
MLPHFHLSAALAGSIFGTSMRALFRLTLCAALVIMSAAASADVFINAGGPATGSYVADRNFTGGSAYTWSGQTGVYATERWSSSSFSYAIPVTAGQVQVTLKFRESCAAGCPYQRVFRVTAEGTTVLNNFSVPANTVSDQTFTVTTDATLNLVFTRITGEAWVNAIEVRQVGTNPAPTVSLGAAPVSIATGASATLTWSSTNATSCNATGAWSGAQALSGSASTGALNATANYTLTCTGPGGNASQSATVTVVPPPAVSLTATPASISSGSSSTLNWSSSNATSCTASGAWSGSQALNGSVSTGALTTNTTYTLTCTGTGGTAAQSATVAVSALPPPTLTLSASPGSVTSGSTSTLTWSSANATSCTASGAWSGIQPTSGTFTTPALTATSTYTLTCTGAGGNATQNATVMVGSPPAGPFPLRVESGKRHLVDVTGQPFALIGDAAWSLIAGLTREEVDLYLEDRRVKGFNAVLVNLIEHWFVASPPRNAYGQGPFLTPGDFATPNEAYFAHAEYVISKAAEKGMLVLLAPAYMGYAGGQEGWYQEMQTNGAAKLQAYGQYVANRFLAYDNILWVHGGDYNPPDLNLLRAVVNGMRAVDSRWLHTFHGGRGTSALGLLTGESWLNVNTEYTDAYTVAENALLEYARSPMPAFMIEGGYEFADGDQQMVRRQAYQSMLSGMCGHVMGSSQIWAFSSGWQSGLNSPGANSMTRLKNLLASRAWHMLVPDAANTLLTGGVGSSSGRAVASLAADGTFAFAYTPDARTLTFDLSRLSGPRVQAAWYDPASGASSTVAGSPFVANGSRNFTPPGNNANGQGDWVLVLDSIP